MNSKKFIYLTGLLCVLTACESRMERNKRLICGNGEYKFWYVANAKSKYNLKSFVYFDREGRYQLYNGDKEITPAYMDDVMFISFWEMTNDSTIIYKWKRDGEYKIEETILHISEDSLVVRYKDSQYMSIDTLVSIPDSLKYLNVIPMIEKHSYH